MIVLESMQKQVFMELKMNLSFFAETFCELVTKHNPSNTAKALDIYLKGDKLL